MEKSVVNGVGLVSPSRKRPRSDSLVDEGRRPSPHTRGKAGIGQDTLDVIDAHGSGVKEE